MFGQAELRDMIEKDNGAEAKCEFCGEVYQANCDHLSQLIEELRSRTDSPKIRRRSILF